VLAGTAIVLAAALAGPGTAGAPRPSDPGPAGSTLSPPSAPRITRGAALTSYGLASRHPRTGGFGRLPRPRVQHRRHPLRRHPLRRHPLRHHPKRHDRRRHPRPRGTRSHGTPQQIARSLLTGFHWAHSQFRYLNLLWTRESGWNRYASNPSSGAYGIPQAVPGDKMASAGPHWRSSARTQIIWGMGYIKSRYVTPWQAWQHELRCGWY